MELSDLLSDQLVSFCGDLDTDDDIDAIFAAAFDILQQSGPASTSIIHAETTEPTSSTPTANCNVNARFAPPKTDDEIKQLRSKGIPKKTLEDTHYCMKVWEQWCNYARQTGRDIPPIQTMQQTKLQQCLTSFVLEVRKKNGEEYSPDTLHHLCCGIMRFLRSNGWPSIDLFTDTEFTDFRAVLDSEMKRLQAQGIGTKKKQAEPLTEEQEEILWEKGLLGDATPQTLLDTIVFMNGLYFALRSGSEHRALRFFPPQIEVVEREGEHPYLQYTEDTSKNRPGGLKGRKVKPKVVRHHANTENPDRCFVRLFKLYTSLCPADAPKDVFYLKPLTKPTPTCWYSNQPVGHNKLSQTVSRLCKQAGIHGYKTNHSLRVTTATRLYASGVDEQLVMERTGHRSLDGVRTYKRTSNEQQVAISDVLNRVKRSRVESPPNTQTISTPTMPGPLAVPSQATQAPVTQFAQTSANASIPGHFHFNSCSSVTINFNCNTN